MSNINSSTKNYKNLKAFSIIDIGTNSIKYLNVEKRGGNNFIILDEKILNIRIGEEISKKKYRLNQSNVTKVSKEIHDLISKQPLSHTRIVATSAAREAQNKDILIKQIYKDTKLKLEILDGTKEAYYIARAILVAEEYKKFNDILAFDLGGGSLEFIKLENKLIKKCLSLPLGALRLTKKFNLSKNEIVNKKTLIIIKNHVIRILEESLISINKSSNILASGGSLHILQKESPNKELIEYKWLNKFFATLCNCNKKNIIEKYKIPANRADIFPCSILIILSIMEYFKIQYVIYSKHSLKYGVLNEMLME